MIFRRLVAGLAATVASGGSTADSDRSTADSEAGRFGVGRSDRGRSDRGRSDRGRSDRGRSDRGQSDRGQSELVGTVLILGLSMAVIGTSVTLGGVALGDLISTAESNNVENGMSHLSSKVSLVALGDADSQRFSLGLMREGTVTVQPGAGSITIANVTNNSRTELFNSSLGAVVYSGGSREIAYQGGGIWTKHNGNATLSSPPEYYYRGTTLTFPIIQVTGEGAVGGQPTGRITPVGESTNAVPGVPTPLENGTIEIKIQSEYYEGWYEFLTQRADGRTRLYHSNNTVVSTLTVPDEVTFNNALSVRTTYDASGSADIDGPAEDNAAHRSADSIIASEVAEAEDTGATEGCLTDSTTCTAGTYYVDGDLVRSEELEIDTSSGNVTIVVDGNLDLQNNDITVTDTSTDNGVKYYINGSFRAQGGAYVGTDSPEPESDRNVLFIADQFLDDSTGGGTVTLEAIIYAPDADVESNGNAQITGSLVANSLDVNGNFDIDYTPSLQGTTIEITGAADLLTYLHASHNEVRVELN